MPDKLKTCKKCGEAKPLEAFSPQKDCRDGRRPDCKACKTADMNRARREDPEKFRKRDRDRYANSPERQAAMKATSLARYYANRETIRLERKAWYEANKAQISAQRKADRAENRDEINAKVRARRLVRRAEINARQRAWHARNPDRVKAMYKRYYATNAADYKRRAMERRARVAAVTVKPINRMDIYERDGGHCRNCNIELAPNNWHLDHIVPIALGGPHEWGNLQALCAPCNLKKYTKLEGQIALPV